MEVMEDGGVPRPPVAAPPAWCLSVISASDAVDRGCTFTFVAATVAFAVIMLVGVFFRYVLNDSLAWSDEVGLMVFIWATFLSIASGYRHDKHVNLDIVVRKLSPSWSKRATVLAEGMSLGYLLSLTVSGFETLPLAAGMHSDALRLPLTIPFVAI